MKTVRFLARTATLLTVIALSLTGASKKHPYSPHEKAFYADTATVEFVRPGLTITINSASLAADGTISVLYGLTDPNGLPLDSAGVTTPGTIGLSFVAAVIPNSQEQYTTYTTTSATGTLLGTIQQPGADSSGTSVALAAVGIEARRTEVVLAGTTSQQSIQYGAPNKVVYFSVDGSTVVPRRDVVALANCNQCHVALSLHGTLRNNTEYCVMCHNPSNTDASTRASAVVPADKAAPPQGINFNLLVHRIHYGINMQAFNRTYIVVGFGGSHNDFSSTLFPALAPTGAATDTRNCSLCHINGTEQSDLALMGGLHPVVDPQGYINPNQPISSACSGCHVDLPTASHMLSNTTVLGEACVVCHGPGAVEAVDQVHAQY